MAVTSIGNSLNNYALYYTPHNRTEKIAQDENIERITQTDETISSNKTEARKPKNQRTLKEYSDSLYKKFDFLNRTTSMYGIKTTVAVSGAFIEKCANDPEKAKFLEENLAAIPNCMLSNSTIPGNLTVTYATFIIDDDGNISEISGSTNDPDGKIARENAAKKLKQNKEKTNKEEKLAAKRAEKRKAERKQMAKIIEESIISDIEHINIGNNFNSYS